MKAWRVHTLGSIRQALHLEECSDLAPSETGLVIEVEAIGLNFSDLLLIQGKYQVQPAVPFIPGAEAVGRIIATGKKSRFCVGQRVIAHDLWGACAQQMAVEDDHAFPIPELMNLQHAAALHVVYQTAYFALHRRGHLKSGETVLIHGASGGVGIAAIQIAKAAGAQIIATASSPEKLSVCRQVGADHLINYTTQNFTEEVLTLTKGKGANLIYDPIGGTVFEKSTHCIAFGGRILIIGFASGQIPSILANRIMLKNIAVIGLHWGAYYKHAAVEIDDTHQQILKLYKDGNIVPVILKTFDFTQYPKALLSMEKRKSIGKVILLT